MPGKTQLVSFDCSKKSGTTDVKMDGFIHAKKLSFKIMRLSFPSKLDWGSSIFHC